MGRFAKKAVSYGIHIHFWDAGILCKNNTIKQEMVAVKGSVNTVTRTAGCAMMI